MKMPEMTKTFRMLLWGLFVGNVIVALLSKNYSAATGWCMASWASSTWAFKEGEE